MQKLPAGISTNSNLTPPFKFTVCVRPVTCVGDCAEHDDWRGAGALVLRPLVGVGVGCGRFIGGGLDDFVEGEGVGVGLGLRGSPPCPVTTEIC
jgi:hypothetical protein